MLEECERHVPFSFIGGYGMQLKLFKVSIDWILKTFVVFTLVYIQVNRS